MNSTTSTLDRDLEVILAKALENVLEEALQIRRVRKPCLGKRIWGKNWRNDVALTEEERVALST